MQPTLLQSKIFTTASCGANMTAAFTNPVKFGSVIVITAVGIGTQPQGVFDGAVDSYFNVENLAPTTYPQLPNAYIATFYSTSGVPLGTSDTMNIAMSATGHPGMFIAREYSGLPPGLSTPAIDAQTWGPDCIGQGSGTQLDSNQGSPGFANAQGRNLLYAIGLNDGAQAMTENGMGFTNLVNVSAGGYTLTTADQYQNVVNTPDASFTMAGSANWVCLLIDFYNKNPGNVIASQAKMGTGTNSAVATYPVAPTAGNVLIASVYSSGGTNAISGWTQLVDENFTGTHHVTAYQKVSDGTEGAITATGTGTMDLHIYEFNSLASPVVADGTPIGSATATTNTQLNSGAITTTNPLDVIFGSFATDIDTTGQTTDSGPGVNGITLLGDMQQGTRLADAILYDHMAESGKWQAVWDDTAHGGTVTFALPSTPPMADPNNDSLTQVGVGS